jgi:hypothetical protein
MRRTALWVLAGCLSAFALAGEQTPQHGLSAAQIVEKNAVARGGLEAWRKIQTMVWVGHVDSANAPAQNLPFILALKRPNKTRFELTALNQMAARVFDGKEGWKLHPTGSGKADLQPYTMGELKFARDEQVIDGPLIDHEAKGASVTLEGIDQVDGHDAYRLGVRLPSGVNRQVWIDAQTFLDVKVDRQARGALGQPVTVEVMYRNYRNIDGLQIPTTIESGTATSEKKDKLVIDKISLNPPLEDFMFGKPTPQGRHNSVSIGADASQATRAMGRPAP